MATPSALAGTLAHALAHTLAGSVARSSGRSVARVVGALGLCGLALGCGSPNPRILDADEEARGLSTPQLGQEMSEQAKIEALIEKVRRSRHVFVHDDIERNGEATADKLQLLLERDPTGVRSAREFIARIAAPERTDEPPDRVVLSKEESLLARHWYEARLAEREGRPIPPADPEELRQAQEHARRLAILDALRIVETSELRFVAPPRKAVAKPKPRKGKPKPKRMGSKRKPKRKEYTGPQFADMLRTKWEYLGADIDDLDTFVEEIASASFSSMVRYRVVRDDGAEEDFARWLRLQLDTERSRLAQGGAP
ncbi:MAG: hypothetical protein AAGF11_29935 [Myxococcota bacterium]